MKNLTVLHSFPTWLPQTQTWMHSQVSELQKLGVDAHVVCERTLNLDQFIVNNIHCLATENIFKKKWDQGLRKLGVRQHLNYLVEVGKKMNATIVHSHFGNIGWANLGAVRELGVKHVVTFYGFDVNKLPTQEPVWRVRYRQLFEEADLFLCEGSHMASCLVALGCPSHKVKVQHLGVDVDRFKFKPRHWHAGEAIKVLIAASFNEKKGIPYALEALGMVSKDIPIELTIIGDARSDDASQQEKAKILNLLESTGLKAKTRMLGYQPHVVMMQEAYAHHLFLHPSVTAADGDTEGGAPVCIIEMLATGMPVVSTTHCDIPEVMGPELQHLLVPEREVDVLKRRLIYVCQNASKWGHWAVLGRYRIMEEYDQTKQSVRLSALYQQRAYS